MFTKDEVTRLAFKIYKENQSLEKSIYELAKSCTIINSNIKDGFDIKPLETDNLILLIRDDVNGELILPPEVIRSENPSRSQIDWYIAEKYLLLEEIKKIIAKNN